MFQFFLLTYIYTITCSNLPAQAPYFKKIAYDKEKKGAKLLKIFQDNKGYMWLGTNLGICRYDGIHFNYLEKDSNQVSCISENNDGIVWVGHNNGAIEYIENGSVKKFTPTERLPGVKITDILFDKQNRLWFSTYGDGIYCYENNTLYNINAHDGLSDNVVNDLILTDDNTIWAATDIGVSICSFMHGKKNITIINDKNGLPDNIVRSFKKDNTGNIWIALQDKGVCYYNKLTRLFSVPDQVKNWKYGQVNEILPLKREVFIGTEDNGIIEIHPGLPTLNKMLPVKRTRINSIQQLLLDKNEQVWVVADNILSIANCNLFQIIEIPTEWQDAIKAITTDETGKIWFANQKGIFSKANNNEPIKQEDLQKKIDLSAVVSLYADYNNTIWIGTYNDGLYHYDPFTKSLLRYNKLNGIIDDNIFSIAGTGNEIWLGTLGGATRMDISNAKPLFTNFSRQNGLSNNYIYNVFIDAEKNKWFSTDGSGISKFNNSVFLNYNHITGLEKNIVYTSTQDIYGNIWFTGLNSGLFQFDGKSVKHYSLKNGLQDNEIMNAVADDNGNLLLSHTDGLEIFNIRKDLFIYYGAESGFENIRPQINAYCKTSGNSILIGATDKIIQYYPTDKIITQLPLLVMNDVLLYFKPIEFKPNQQFDYNENHISFDYAGLCYINPETVNYQYQLEGNSKDWISTRDHLISFPNLRPGHYTFRVKSSMNDNFRYSPVLTYSFTVLKPFFKTTWFTIAAILATCLLIYFLVQIKIRLVRYEQGKEKQQLITKLAMLKNQLNPHFLFNSFNTLLNIIDKDKPMALEYTEKLSDFYRDMLLVQDKEMVSVQEELQLLENYIYLQQKRFGNNLQLVFHIAPQYLKANIPPLTLQLLAENALKHNSVTAEKKLSIKIESAQNFLIVSNNINRQEVIKKSTGTGLKNIQQRVQLLTGEAVKIIESDTEFNVIIPLKK